MPIVKRVAHDADAASLDQSAWGVMAHAPLRTAPWGVAMGASEAEVLASVSRLRTRFIAIGAASLVTLLAGGALAVGVRRRTEQIDARAGSHYECQKHRRLRDLSSRSRPG